MKGRTFTLCTLLVLRTIHYTCGTVLDELLQAMAAVRILEAARTLSSLGAGPEQSGDAENI